MHMPENVKKELKLLDECIQHERERFLQNIKPYQDRISFIHNCYPEPIIATPEIVERLLEIHTHAETIERAGGE